MSAVLQRGLGTTIKLGYTRLMLARYCRALEEGLFLSGKVVVGMHRIKFRQGIMMALVLSLWVGLFTGCSRAGGEENLTTTGFAFDTTYTITLYEGGSREVLDSCIKKCSEYERIFSRTLEGSELYQVNELEQIYGQVCQSMDAACVGPYTEEEVRAVSAAIAEKKPESNTLPYQIEEDGRMVISVSDMLRDIIKKGLEYGEISGGSFDITVEPLTSIWNFKEEDPVIPDKEEVKAALPFIDYRKVFLEGNRLSFQQPGMGIDLGGIAKGFIADDLKSYLAGQGVRRAFIYLGGNVLCFGGKSETEAFRVGIQQPFAERNEIAAAVEVRDMSVVSSGVYERYIKAEDGVMYHHILNPDTGYSYDNDLFGVTILSEKSVDGDGLSTTCFAMGKEKGLTYVNSLEGVYAVFITKDGKLWYSDGMKDYLCDS